jgi:hypothetical protein
VGRPPPIRYSTHVNIQLFFTSHHSRVLRCLVGLAYKSRMASPPSELTPSAPCPCVLPPPSSSCRVRVDRRITNQLPPELLFSYIFALGSLLGTYMIVLLPDGPGAYGYW